MQLKRVLVEREGRPTLIEPNRRNKREMNQRAKIQLTAAIAMLAIASLGFVQHWRNSTRGAQAYFYDLSKGALFVASADLIPPIRGIDNAEEDGVKAVVIETKPDDPKSR